MALLPNVTIAPPALIIRSATDPYVLVGGDTSCKYDFGITAGELESIGIPLFIPGIILLFSFVSGLTFLLYRRVLNPKP